MCGASHYVFGQHCFATSSSGKKDGTLHRNSKVVKGDVAEQSGALAALAEKV